MPQPSRQILPKSSVTIQAVFHANASADIDLPIVLGGDRYGIATSRWVLTWRERLSVLFSGSVWVQQMTFRKPLQPVKVLSSEPTRAECYIGEDA